MWWARERSHIKSIWKVYGGASHELPSSVRLQVAGRLRGATLRLLVRCNEYPVAGYHAGRRSHHPAHSAASRQRRGFLLEGHPNPGCRDLRQFARSGIPVGRRQRTSVERHRKRGRGDQLPVRGAVQHDGRRGHCSPGLRRLGRVLSGWLEVVSVPLQPDGKPDCADHVYHQLARGEAVQWREVRGMNPAYQERFQVYVMGPDQDSRLANVAAGQTIERVNLKIDLDAPFVLRRRALGPVTADLPFVKTKWAGPTGDYRSDLILESLRHPYAGQNGSPTKVSPEITYPPGGTLTLDLQNTSVNPIANLTFYWIGVSRYPWGTLPAPTYPAEFRAEPFAQPFVAAAMGAPEIRINQPYMAKSDGDWVIRGGQAGKVGIFGGIDGGFLPGILAPTTAMSVVLKDWNGLPYMNDWVDINVLFGMGNVAFGTGPGHPGIIYPEIYLPAMHQLLIDVQQSAAGLAGADLLINFIGAKAFKGAR